MIKATLASTGQALLSTSQGAGCPGWRSKGTKDVQAPSKGQPAACLGPAQGGPGGKADPHPTSTPASEAPGDSWDTRSKQTDKQAYSPTGSPMGGWPPGDTTFSPSPVPGQGLGSQHKRWQWSPPSFLLSPPISLSSGSLARAGTPLRPPQDRPVAPGLAPCPALAPCSALAPAPQIQRGGWELAGWVSNQLGRLVSKLTIRHNGENTPFVNTWSI